jgi:hypothetical protein
MKEVLSIEIEHIDDIPLLITYMQRMKGAELLDKHIPTHGHRKGLSVGELSMAIQPYQKPNGSFSPVAYISGMTMSILVRRIYLLPLLHNWVRTG